MVYLNSNNNHIIVNMLSYDKINRKTFRIEDKLSKALCRIKLHGILAQINLSI